jgi:hypothetical protein
MTAWIRRVLVAGGLVVMAVGLNGVLREESVGKVHYVGFLFVSAVFNDALVMPLALVAGLVTARLLPAWLRLPAQAALYISAAVTLIALPLLIGNGYDSGLPSALPRDYPRGLAIVVAVVWIAALAVALFRGVRATITRRRALRDRSRDRA